MAKKIKISFNAPATLWLVALSFCVTLLGIITSGKSTMILFMTRRTLILDPLMYVRLFTHVLGREGWGYFIGNVSYILLLGPMFEEKCGSKKITGVILITALITGIINNLMFPNTGLCGASGIVFAFILLASFTDFRQGEIPVTVILIAIIFLGNQVYEGIIYDDNISHISHRRRCWCNSGKYFFPKELSIVSNL